MCVCVLQRGDSTFNWPVGLVLMACAAVNVLRRRWWVGMGAGGWVGARFALVDVT